MMLNYLTPHGKWQIHSTYGDNQRMTTLSRGVEPLWINERTPPKSDSWITTGSKSTTTMASW